MKKLKKILQVSLIIILFISCSKDDGASLNPTITNISPTSGPKTTQVTISGHNFGTDTSTTQVFFNEIEAVVESITDTEIIVQVPAKAFTGVIKVIKNGKPLIGPVFTYTTDVQVTTFAGSTQGYTDGKITTAKFFLPLGVAIDTDGNVYVIDSHRIRKITPKREVSTLAGSTEGFLDDLGINAQFNESKGLAIDSENNIYMADRFNHKIRKITPDGMVTTFAGSTEGFSEGIGISSQFSFPNGIAVDSEDNIYVADVGNHRIRKITPFGVVSTLAGSTSGFANGLGTNAQFFSPQGVAVDSKNNIYVTDTFNSKIRKITPLGMVSTLAVNKKGGVEPFVQFSRPRGIAIDSKNNIYVSEIDTHRILKITPFGMVSTLAGGVRGFVDGTASVAKFYYPLGLAVDSEDNVYIADVNNYKIRKITQE